MIESLTLKRVTARKNQAPTLNKITGLGTGPHHEYNEKKSGRTTKKPRWPDQHAENSILGAAKAAARGKEIKRKFN